MALRCQQCTKPIDKEKIRKGGVKRAPQFCNQECAVLWRKEHGFFYEFSKAGNTAQARFKAENGYIPGYEQRAKALRRPDRPNRRPKKKG